MISSDRSIQTYFTLKTINNLSENKNVQIILIDDSSTDPIKIDELYVYTHLQIDLIKGVLTQFQ